MSQLNDTNYPQITPLVADYLPVVRDSDGAVKTVSIETLAGVIGPLVTQTLEVTVLSGNNTLSDEQFVVVNDGSASQQNLPASSLNAGRAFWIANKGAGAVTIDADGTDTIEGAASIVLAQYETVCLRSDGTGTWFEFGS